MSDISVHRTNIEGQVAEASAVAGNPLLMGGDDGTNSRFIQMRTEDDSIVAGDIQLVTIGLLHGYDGAAWERVITDAAGRIETIARGLTAHDGPVATNPLLIAARANLDEPDDPVGADDDVVHLWADRLGRLVMVDGHSNPVDPVYVNATGSGDTTLLAAPGASLSLYIQKILITNGGSVVNNVQIQVDGTAVNRGPGDLAADGGGAMMDFGARGWKIAANTALDINLGAAGDVHATVLQHYIAA